MPKQTDSNSSAAVSAASVRPATALPLPPLDARTQALLDQAVLAVGEQHREMVLNVYSLGCLDGQIQALDRASGLMEGAQSLLGPQNGATGSPARS